MTNPPTRPVPVGTRVRVLAWQAVEATTDAPARRVPAGTAGTVTRTDERGLIHVDWDNGVGLGLLPDRDRFEVIPLVEATARSRSMYVRRERDGQVGWVGPLRRMPRAQAERTVWIAAGWRARVVEATDDVRTQVRLWTAKAKER